MDRNFPGSKTTARIISVFSYERHGRVVDMDGCSLRGWVESISVLAYVSATLQLIDRSII